MAMDSLWGDEFVIPETPKKTKKIIEKVSKPKEVKVVTERTIKSKTVDIHEKIRFIEENVYRILGKYKENTVVIKTKEQLAAYIDAAIANGEIAIDTETNNSLDPITCKLMGPCIYTPGQKNAYIPINHVDVDTRERLDWQLTEEDISEEFRRLIDTLIIMHNGKFDYQVIKCTTGEALKIYWDTMIAAKILDENERSAGLKNQYIQKIDSSIEKYDIEHLFEGMEYAIFDPELFALYAATDAFMTYKLYKWQKEQLTTPINAGIYSIFKTIEMPLVTILAEMEMRGMSVDQQYAQLLSAKFHKRLDAIDVKIAEELNKLSAVIEDWRKTPEANFKEEKLNKAGEVTYAKSKNEQLETPINLASPTQLAILFYDILKCPAIDKKKPRGTGEEELKGIAKHLKSDLCNLIIDRRELVKLLTTYIDVIPELAKRWPDGRVRTHFNQYGAATGRLSSSDPINFQNIPSHEKTIRMLFCSRVDEHIVEPIANEYIIPETDEVETPDGWMYVSELTDGDYVVIGKTPREILGINRHDTFYSVFVKEDLDTCITA